MFSQHPFTLEHHYSLDASFVLPVWKRALDVICGIAALPLLGLVTFVFTAITMMCSRGPIFYRQQYAGPSGRGFPALRFRTMHLASQSEVEDISGGGLPGHARLSAFIPGGGVLRATGLVDLPQVINVLRGEMSMVGPRPRLDSGMIPPVGAPRSEPLAVPGLTGLWRFSGNTSPAHDELVTWERTYAGSMSFMADLKVIARSMLAMVGLR